MDYTTLADDAVIAKTIGGLKGRNVSAIVVESKEEALSKIKELIPAGASVMNGSSTTLKEIGYIEHLESGKHGWNNLHEGILAEKDPQKQAQLRRQALLSDYYLGSAAALAQTGELIFGSNSGSQLPHIVYSSPNLIFVVSTNKITPTLEEAKNRLYSHVVPLEDERLMKANNMHTKLNKEVIFYGEAAYTGRKITVILVKEKLGF